MVVPVSISPTSRHHLTSKIPCAEYVHAAVDGRNAKSGEETTIPIPRSDGGVAELLTQLEADRDEVAATNIDNLEANINAAVYDLFDVTDGEREVVEEYLEVF